MRVIGLTGSIGTGKTTTAGMFRALGVPVHDADAEVHRLYREAETVAAVEEAFPGVARGGAIDRARLAEIVAADPAALPRLDEIVHPLVRAREAAFLNDCRATGAQVAVLDVPLLLETGGERRVDVVVVVSVALETQRSRVSARPGMTEARYAALLARQMPDAQKRLRAHFVIDTGRGLKAAQRDVAGLIRALG